jgi:cytoskeletal protein CcmA (bactofilin family)
MTRPGTPATIGQSVQIKGELSGQEDLIIDGSIDGKILVHDHHLTVGPNGQIHAEVQAKSVRIDGAVAGNITADDKVEITSSGSVLGDIKAPRVALADGSRFKGGIDMGRERAPSTQSDAASTDRDATPAASEP